MAKEDAAGIVGRKARENWPFGEKNDRTDTSTFANEDKPANLPEESDAPDKERLTDDKESEHSPHNRELSSADIQLSDTETEEARSDDQTASDNDLEKPLSSKQTPDVGEWQTEDVQKKSTEENRSGIEESHAGGVNEVSASSEETLWQNAPTEESIQREAVEAMARQRELRKRRNEERGGTDHSDPSKIPADSRLAPSIPWRLPTRALSEVYIENAGLVLIWPFLSTLFKGLGWVEGDQFTSEETRQRAACYLQYLVTGVTEYDEEKMVLNKLLVGLPAEEAIDCDIVFTDEELEEAEHLLQVIIQNWAVLKGTSVQGLRQTFLLRDGLFKKEFNGWKLFVQRTTMDILLEKLPWSYAVIKLPWVQDIIYVEW